MEGADVSGPRGAVAMGPICISEPSGCGEAFDETDGTDRSCGSCGSDSGNGTGREKSDANGYENYSLFQAERTTCALEASARAIRGGRWTRCRSRTLGRVRTAPEDQGRPITAVSCACGERHALRDRSISPLSGGVRQA